MLYMNSIFNQQLIDFVLVENVINEFVKFQLA